MWLPVYATPTERAVRILVFLVACAVLLFLIAPLLVIFPLSLSKDPFFTLPIKEFSFRWYADFFENSRWTQSLWNSLVTATASTIIAAVTGTAAALGLSYPQSP